MAKVNLNINGRQYALGCDDGEEDRLNRLGEELDQRVSDLANKFGQTGDLSLMVMAGITLMDEIEDLRKDRDASISEATLNLRQESQSALETARTKEITAIDQLNAAAQALENMALRFSAEESPN